MDKTLSTMTVRFVSFLSAGIVSMPVWAAEDHSAAAHEEEVSGLPQFAIETFSGQVFWLFVAFTVMYLFFSKKVLPELGGVIDKRRLQISSDLEHAETFRREAEDAKESYELQLDEARAEARSLIAKTEQQIKAKAEKRMGSFRETSRRAIETTQSRIEQSKEAILDDLSQISADLSQISVEKVSGIKVSDKDAGKAVNMVLNQAEQESGDDRAVA